MGTTLPGRPGTSARAIAKEVLPLDLLGSSVLLARSVSRPGVPGVPATAGWDVAVIT